MKNVNELIKLGETLVAMTDGIYDNIKFDITEWVEMETLVKPEEKDCCTTACAIGLLPYVSPNTGLDLSQGFPVFRGADGFNAIACYFEITISDVLYLFSSDSYDGGDNTGAQVVGERILDFCRKQTD